MTAVDLRFRPTAQSVDAVIGYLSCVTSRHPDRAPHAMYFLGAQPPAAACAALAWSFTVLYDGYGTVYGDTGQRDALHAIAAHAGPRNHCTADQLTTLATALITDPDAPPPLSNNPVLYLSALTELCRTLIATHARYPFGAWNFHLRAVHAHVPVTS